MIDKINNILNKNKRDSNMELLRIIAMIMIIMHHICMHAIVLQLNNPSYKGALLFSKAIFFKKLSILQYLQIAGMVSNNIFILIAGFYLIKKNINFLKQAKKIIPEMLFATILLIASSLIFQHFSKKFNGLISINVFNEEWWFIGYYFITILIASLFLNNYLNKLNKTKYLTFLGILFTIISFSWPINLLNGLTIALVRQICGIFLYSLGGYIRKYNPFKNIKTSFLLLLIFIIFVLIYLSYRNFTINNINTAALNKVAFNQSIFSYEIYSIIPITLSILIFLLFTRINIKSNKIINYLASASFMVYIIHDNEFFRGVFRLFDWITLLYKNVPKFILYMILFALIVYIIGTLVYVLYKLFIRFCNSNMVKKLIYKKEA